MGDRLNTTVASLTGTAFDVLVIGGGIVGAGVARDAASRGLRVLLVERADFASGTSGRSSRLLHGGLRYLAQLRFGLVREASVEKMTLSRIAPHLCRPLPFLFPVRRGSGWWLGQLTLGVWLYDLLCGGSLSGRNLGRSASLDADQVRRLVPQLRPDGLAGATRHYDALTNDARLVLDTLLSAAEDGAILCNYAAFLAAEPAGDGWRCTARDELTGETVEVAARAVVNAAGAFAAGFPQSGVRLRLTKGVHLVLDRRRLPVEEAIVLAEGRRILFVIPWGERLIVGTTDTDYADDPAAVRAEPADVRYLLGVVNDAFPGVRLGPTDVLATWAGVRPLVAAGQRAGSPSDISRAHVIAMPRPGWFDVAGGKLTTYRLMAEQTVDRIGRHENLGLRLGPSRTGERPLAQGRFSGILPPPVGPDIVAEACRREWAVRLDDVLLRRTSWHYYYADPALTGRVAGWMADHLGWDAARQAAEIERFRALVDPAG